MPCTPFSAHCRGDLEHVAAPARRRPRGRPRRERRALAVGPHAGHRRPTDGFTGYTGPSKPYSSRFRKSSWPMLPRHAARADHRDRPRRQQPRDRRRFGVTLSRPGPRRSTPSSARSRTGPAPSPRRSASRPPSPRRRRRSASSSCSAACRPRTSRCRSRGAITARCSSSKRGEPATLLVVGDCERDLGFAVGPIRS